VPASTAALRRVTPARLGAALAALALALAAALFAAQRGADPGQDAQALMEQLERSLRGEAAPAAPADAEALLRMQLQRHPGDVRALVLMARLDMKQQRWDAAAAGYRQALAAANSKAARDPDVWVECAEAIGMQQGGTLAGEPARLVGQALALDPAHAGALDLAGSAAWEAQDFAAAASHWKRLLGQMAPGSARHGELSAAIRRAEQRARLALPPPRA